MNLALRLSQLTLTDRLVFRYKHVEIILIKLWRFIVDILERDVDFSSSSFASGIYGQNRNQEETLLISVQFRIPHLVRKKVKWASWSFTLAHLTSCVRLHSSFNRQIKTNQYTQVSFLADSFLNLDRYKKYS